LLRAGPIHTAGKTGHGIIWLNPGVSASVIGLGDRGFYGCLGVVVFRFMQGETDMSLRLRTSHRRGLATVEWFCILGFGTLVLLASVSSLGGIAKLGLDDNAKQWGDPSQTVSETAASPASEAESESKSKSKGNNGVGNGSEDGQPPGNPPVNDGEGTGPGNPGNKGGAKK
jgi:hypothetical protein